MSRHRRRPSRRAKTKKCAVQNTEKNALNSQLYLVFYPQRNGPSQFSLPCMYNLDKTDLAKCRSLKFDTMAIFAEQFIPSLRSRIFHLQIVGTWSLLGLLVPPEEDRDNGGDKEHGEGGVVGRGPALRLRSPGAAPSGPRGRHAAVGEGDVAKVLLEPAAPAAPHREPPGNVEFRI